jgi:uncharacterized protein
MRLFYPRASRFSILDALRCHLPFFSRRILQILAHYDYNAPVAEGVMRVLISGSTGMVGAAVLDSLRQQGHDVARLVRPSTRNRPARMRSPEPASLTWNPLGGTLDPAANGADAVVHLAGASIADGRWTASRKRVLYDSRVAATRHLIEALAQFPDPPKIFVAASAIGFYGNRGDEELTESSAPGHDFLADLCCAWEGESGRANSFGARVVVLRFGIILAKDGGALPRMAFPFRLGAGGRIGSGRQWMSWVALEDVVAIIEWAVKISTLSGAVNVVAPNPVRNADFAATLGRVLRRPALLPTPAFALNLALGEMASALLLSSQKVLPGKLQSISYPFMYQSLERTLRRLLTPFQ